MRDFPERPPRPLPVPCQPGCSLPAGEARQRSPKELPAPRHKANRHYLPLPLPRAAKPSRKCPYLPPAASPPRCLVPKAACAVPRGAARLKNQGGRVADSWLWRKTQPREAQPPPVPSRIVRIVRRVAPGAHLVQGGGSRGRSLTPGGLPAAPGGSGIPWVKAVGCDPAGQQR